MGNKTRHNSPGTFSLMASGTVAANSSAATNTPVIPSGDTITVISFGGSVMTSPGFITLEFGSVGSWEVVRSLSHTYDFVINKTFVGDGVKRLRIFRKNNTGSIQTMNAWLETIT